MQKLIGFFLCMAMVGNAVGIELGKKETDAAESKTIVDGEDSISKQKALERAVAEITKAIEQNQDSKSKIFNVYITPATSQSIYAAYFKSVASVIEKVGTSNFPERNGKKLYGNLVVYIPIAENGQLFTENGGPRIEKSSGNKYLDQHALKIVQMATPFPPFQSSGLTINKKEVRIIITSFNFMNDGRVKFEKHTPPLP